jgi:hypothetical protein
MKKLLIVAMACYGLAARAQVRESENFLYLYSDSVIYARDIKLRPDFSGYLRLRADSKGIPMDRVKFFSNEDGFFANTRKLNLIGVSAFSERIMEGRINVFQERSYDPISYSSYRYDRRGRNRIEPVIDVSMYYNKGYDDLKKLNYRNLKNDMSDNPESMDMLRNYRRSMNTTNLLYVAAGASLLTGFLTVATGGAGVSNSKFALGGTLMGLGLGFATGGYLKYLSGNRKLENAVEAYNR